MTHSQFAPVVRNTKLVSVVMALMFAATAVQADPVLDVVICEIMYHPPGSTNLEYVEITNKGSQTVDLSGWTIRDGIDYEFPPGTTIAPGQYRVIASEPATVAGVYGLSGVLGPFSKNLSNGGERIELRDHHEGLVGEVDYKDVAPWPTGGDGDGRSIELIDVTKNPNVGRHWMPSSRILGSPGMPNSPAHPPIPVVINEFQARSSVYDWIELYNPGDVSIDLNGYHITDDPKQPTRATINSSWTMGTTIIPPKGYWLTYETDWGGFGLSAGGEQVYLVAPDGATWVDGYDYGNHPVQDYSEGRYPDGSPNWVKFPTTTPLGSNLAPPPSPIVINEIMYHPYGDSIHDLGPEYVELHNTSGNIINIGGWAFTAGIDYTFPPGTTIGPFGYLVLAHNPALVQSTYGISGVHGPYEGKLSNFSDHLVLKDTLKNIVDEVEYRQEGDWPEAPDGDGPSLERANYTMDSRLPGTWRASSGSGTPGGPNSQFVSNPPASIGEVQHAPLVPTSSDSVTVTARVGAGNLTSVTLFYKDDDAGSWSTTTMFDDGQHGDGLAGDGVYGGIIPPFGNKKTVEFYVRALATGGNRNFPLGASANNSCLYSVRDTVPASNLTVYRFVATRENSEGALNSANCGQPHDNTRFDFTFITEDRAYYNCSFRRRSGSRCGPKYSYKVHLTPGYRFRGADRFNLNFEKADETFVRNKVINHFLEYMDLPAAKTEFIHTRYNSYHAPGTSDGYAGVHLYADAHDDDFLKNRFPDDSDGNQYKAVASFTSSIGGTNIAWGGSHSWYEKETNESANDWSDLDNLHNVTKPSFPSSQYDAAVRNAVDVENWAASMAIWAATCLIDSPWHIHNQNYRLYRRFSDDRFIHILYDFDDTYWDTMWDSAGSTASVYADVNRWLNHGPFRREFAHQVWRAVNLDTGEYRDDKIMAEVHFYHNLIRSDVITDPNADVNKFLNSVDGVDSQPSMAWDTRLRIRNQLLRNELSPYLVPLAITTNNGQPITTHSPNLVLQGTAPISAAAVEVNGQTANVSWTSTTQWQAEVTLELMSETVVVRTLDQNGLVTGQVTVDVTCTVCTPNEVDFTTGPLPTEIPYTVDFYDQSSATNITAWFWDFDDGGTSTLQDPAHTFAQWGVTYDVSLTIQADGGPFTVIKPITVGTPIKGDWDRDGDLDMDDYGRFQVCLTGPGVPQNDPDCADAKLDADEDVDEADRNIFVSCMSGAGIPAVTNCQ